MRNRNEFFVVIATVVILAVTVFSVLGIGTGCSDNSSDDIDDDDIDTLARGTSMMSTVRENARKSKANSECQCLKAAIVMYEAEFCCWPANIGTADGLVNGAEYVKMCKILVGENSAKKVYFEAGVGYDENKGFLDPWGRPYQVALDGNYDQKLSETVPVIKAVNSASGRSGQDLRIRVAVYSFGVFEDDKLANDLTNLAKKKKLVTSW